MTDDSLKGRKGVIKAAILQDMGLTEERLGEWFPMVNSLGIYCYFLEGRLEASLDLLQQIEYYLFRVDVADAGEREQKEKEDILNRIKVQTENGWLLLKSRPKLKGS